MNNLSRRTAITRPTHCHAGQQQHKVWHGQISCQYNNAKLLRKKRNSEMWQVTYLPRPPMLHYPTEVVMWGVFRT